MTDITAPTETTPSAWKSFWDRGGFWRAIVLVVAYLALYLAAGRAFDALFADQIDGDDVLSSASSVFFGVTAAIIVGIAILFAFGASVRWLKEVFGPQPIKGSWWMWILPVIVLVCNLAAFAATDYSRYDPSTVATILLTGACVGVAEELITRGYVVKMLRTKGYKEIWVAVLSSLVFALMHAVNALGGQPIATVAQTMVYTFFFGIAMYLTLRATGRLIYPIILHALTDPSIMLFSGGIDQKVTGQTDGATGLDALATLGNVFVIVLGFVFVWFIRGQVKTIGALAEPTA